ncbi:amino acid/polyamine/organocation transporter, APC superfamily [Cruoricaptor ignavus]|uniref:Amino acid/polyamine/organocation transporter, APC superfamily n=1 Tax=Cruoricaptor ignavus TaxID=1118202 RepID=A0A1M6C3X5_9FLAO|nr:amino acid permease [Cruoricaptor ignavus]SHI55699.1 amino acid/polyamine/organocation transporter, APC superfamily [Cruoricaptor ignavus]
MSQLWKTKPLERLLNEASESEKGLKRTLSSGGLIALGIGAIIGAGLFSITGMAAANNAGPGIMISFIIAALGCAFAGLCYAEFASMIPVAGSAYTYTYATLGEFIAWVIGWDLVLEYAVAAATVASSWSGYLVKLFSNYGVALPLELMTTPFDGGIVNLPAVFIVILMSLVLIKGTSESSRLNAIIVVMKVAVVLIFIFVGFKYVRPENLTPFIPENTGEFGEFGWSGVIRAAAIVFFAYVGFDAVSTAAQETKNPKKAMPIGIMGSLLICTVLYVLFAYVMVGVAHYSEFAGGNASDHLAPVAIAIDHMGDIVNGRPVPAYPWLNNTIIIAILLGYASVILVLLMGQSRVFYSMSKDGLLPKAFSEIHPKFRTPFKSNFFFMILVSLFAAFIPGRVVGEMTSIGTLFAFILVCIGVLVMRKTQPNAPRAFKTPLVPLVPILGILVCFGMMAFLPFDTWIRLIAWMMIGLDIYLFRGIKNSFLAIESGNASDAKSYRGVALSGFGLTLLLGILTFFHHQNPNVDDTGLVILAAVLAVFHIFYYGYYFMKGKG